MIFLSLILLFVVSNALKFESERRDLQNPTEPVPCDPNNPGRCECSEEEGFQTYTFWDGQNQRCFTTYIPSEIDQPAPVVLHMQCYARDKLQRLELYPGSGMVQNADRWGFILVGLSSFSGSWRMASVNELIDGEDSCDESLVRDLRYAKKVYDFLESETMRDLVDFSRVYTEGFSQNGNFAGYIAYCLRDQIAMGLQGGSGMHVIHNGQLHRRGNYQDFPEDALSYPMALSPEATNFHTCSFIIKGDPWSDSSYNLEHFAVQNGLDLRFFAFEGTGHRWPNFKDDWWVGCSGMYEPCSAECEQSYKECVAERSNVRNGVRDCRQMDVIGSLQGCSARCAPTLEMLQIYEQPDINLAHGQFGRPIEETTTEEVQECDERALAAEIALVLPAAQTLVRYNRRCNHLYNDPLKEFWFGLSMLQSGLCTEEQIIANAPSDTRWVGRRLIPQLAECLAEEFDTGDCDLDALAEQASKVEEKARESGWQQRCDNSRNQILREWWFAQDMLSTGVCSAEFIEAKSPSRRIGRRIIPQLIECLQN